MKYTVIFYLALIVLLGACQNDSQFEQPKKYFDVKALIQQVVQKLNAQKPLVKKTIQTPETTENQTIRIGNWAKELELFTQVDLNKPAYLNSYLVDSTSNTIKYTLKPNEKLPVQFLSFKEKGNTEYQIEALILVDNYLYSSEKHLTLTWKNDFVTNYQIDGFQKVVFGDKKSFKINGTVVR
jgi:hypothetical protein